MTREEIAGSVFLIRDRDGFKEMLNYCAECAPIVAKAIGCKVEDMKREMP